MSDIAGLILAAGLSSRMGETKALLRFGGGALIEYQIRCILGAGISDILIVTGHDAQSVEAKISAYTVKTVYNENYSDGMFSSVKEGLKAVKHGGYKAVFLLPVDCPLVSPEPIIALAGRFSKGDVKIVYPCHKGRRGHPPLICASLIDGILAYTGEGGLSGALSLSEGAAVSLEAGCGCLSDIDTREDYIRALERFG